MKSILSFSLVLFGITFASGAFAQTPSRTTPVTDGSTVQQDSSKTRPATGTTSRTDGSSAKPSATTSDKNKPAAPAPGASRNDASGGGTNKMAINEQGVPTKTTAKPKVAGLETTTPTPPADPTKKKGE